VITGGLKVTVPRPHSLMVGEVRRKGDDLDGLNFIVTTLRDGKILNPRIERSKITSIVLQGFRAAPRKPHTFKPTNPRDASIEIFFTHESHK
jgi:hypothetical protein